jgi:hypothetical protein
MIEVLHSSHPCDTGASPNRQGYLILGDCPVPLTPLPEGCPPGPADPEAGILRCRCLRTRGIQLLPPADGIALRPRDLVRLHVKLSCGF